MRLSSLIAVFLLLGAPVLALDPSQEINQYGHTRWTLRNAAFKGYPKSMTQTPDGYLWFGTEFGLIRFDGVRFLPWQPPAGTRLPSDSIVKLLTGRDGSLWIGTTLGLARWKDGTLTLYEDLAGQDVRALVEDGDETIWVATNVWPVGDVRLCAVRDVRTNCESHSEFGQFVMSLYGDDRSNLWIGAATGLWRWKPFPPTMLPTGYAFPEVRSITRAGGDLLIALNRGIYRLAGQTLEVFSTPSGAVVQAAPTSLLQDRDGGLWIGTQDQGLVHVHEGNTDRFDRSDGLSGDFVTSLLQDL